VETSYYATDPTAIRLSVSAVVWNEGPGSALLLMQRSDNGAWGLPGGYVEIGESVVQAAAREVFEETGVRVELGRLVGVYSDPAVQVIAYPDGRRVQAVNLCFEARPLTLETPGTPEETLATGYFPASALPAPFVPIHEIRIRDALDGDRAARIR
jgi:ADP-ribose pyrophosphatase YjhB (NUDIX family)